jgi:tryptophan synthase
LTASSDSPQIAIENGVDYARCLQYVRDARAQGLKAPVIFMGYYNSFLAYGEEKAVEDAYAAGANGYIIVDLPPEEALQFRGICKKTGMSYVPLIAPSTTVDRVKFLASIADSFIYVVSKMATTGSSAAVGMNAALPDLLARIRKITPVPLAVGFGIDNRTHFDFVTSAGADGVVIGSKIIKIVQETPEGQATKVLEDYCRSISLKGQNPPALGRKAQDPANDAAGKPDPALPIPPSVEADKNEFAVKAGEKLPSKFGPFGGAFVPESLVNALNELEDAYVKAAADPEFWKEYESMFEYIGRPSSLYFADRLTEKMGGAKIWLKR